MFDAYRLESSDGKSATVSIKNWMLLDCVALLNIIPIIGTIAAIVIYCIIAFGSGSAPSMKNRILASFIWLAIGIVFTIVALAMGLFSVASLGNR